MQNSLKVAKWEIKRNMTNKSFIIGLLSTPIIFLAFFFIPMLFDSSDSVEDEDVTIYVYDELGVSDALQAIIEDSEMDHWTLKQADIEEDKIETQLLEMEQSAYLFMTEEAFEKGEVKLYMTDDLTEYFPFEVAVFEQPLRQLQMDRLGLTDQQKETIQNQISITAIDNVEGEAEVLDAESTGSLTEADPLKRIIPGVFAGIILFSIVMTGMMIFQSASQEKKEKVAEIILSSLTPTELMQGKIIGYFVLGMIQVAIWLVIALPAMMWRFDFPVLKYLLVPEMFLLLFFAFAGYLLFAAIFVGIGATVEDMNGTSNFQAIVIMLPFAPAILISPILSDPSGLIAKIGSFVPITAPAVWLFRLSMLEEWPWIEIGVAILVLLISIWIFMKLAGKIFKIGIMMYGKNATPKEIWKWLWA